MAILDAAKGTHKPVAFEIPIDEELKNAKPLEPQDSSVTLSPAKPSLPKLALSQQDLQAKLANAEARWKDLELAQAERRQLRRRGAKPQLSSKEPKKADPEALKRRLLEKEAHAKENRAREISKLQSKLAKHDEKARRVQERKRALGRASNEDLNLSWGGEDGLETVVLDAKDAYLRPKTSPHSGEYDEIDSGKGSSAVSLSLGSRSGSGRSVGTNGEVIVDERKAIQVAPIPVRYTVS
ncbi:hypothetical protein HDU96_005385 [Phlyctochytrium bullatum]|nr:hypothetical protein HDU96_005385 [Phlyctochytrium bullatum]